MSASKRSYSDPAQQFAHRIADTDKRLTALERGHTHPPGPAGPPDINQTRFVRYYRSTPFTLTAAAWQALPFNQIVEDANSIYNPATGVATIPVAGIYRITLNVTALLGAVGVTTQAGIASGAVATHSAIVANIMADTTTRGGSAGGNTVSCNTTHRFAAGDQFTTCAVSSGNPGLLTSTAETFFTMEFVGI